MSQLQALKSVKSLTGVASLLNFKASALAYVLFKAPNDSKYRSFEISKRSGGTRQINAPCDELMLLQHKLRDLLQSCVDEIKRTHGWEDQLAHGFKPGHSIVTNAHKHLRRRFVLNLDLQNFFGTINFGRVRGFFIKNTDFKLHPSVATVLAQIACYQNSLPQGSPCSPIISNLIGSVLDVRLCKLANDFGCTYSRYADDITFSTNKKDFPTDLAILSTGPAHQWEIGQELLRAIKRCGFEPNLAKTRMQYRTSRQEVTGLVVNRKVNIRSNYRRNVRAMTDRLFKTGRFEFVHPVTHLEGPTVTVSTEMAEGTLEQLHGMLGHIWGIDLYNWRISCGLKQDEEIEDADETAREGLQARGNLYRRFLMYKEFYAASIPTVICEGKTDNIYLLHAIRNLAASFPLLASGTGGGAKLIIRLYRYSKTGWLLGFTGGTGLFPRFINEYAEELKVFKADKMKNPIILLLDRDGGAKGTLGLLAGKYKKDISGDKPFIHVIGNLYVVTTPLPEGKKSSMIEDCFTGETKATKIDGKSFNPDKEHGDNDTFYHKLIFAKYVEANAAKIDFSGFAPLLSRITAVIEHYAQSLYDPKTASEAANTAPNENGIVV